MNVKIERIGKEINKIKGKIEEWQSKVRELEKQKTAMENEEIIETVRGMNVSLNDLTNILKKGGNGVLTGQTSESATANKEEF